ncbi:hypothetical protein V9T40_001989 [Parthenolecanium corni]|uniref:Tr-type G domain-containing protein n=1 Tax=Parthenolecanium corni TaxID=536013 RepID=A0AAN9TWH1_9HEMI
MSRHRHVRQRLYSEDYDDDYDVFGQSVEDDINYSPEDESFIYDRSRNQANLSSRMDNVGLNDTPTSDDGASNLGVDQGNKINQTVPVVQVVRPSNNVTQGFVIHPEKSETDGKPSQSGLNLSVLDSPKRKNVKQKTDSKRNSRNSSPSLKRTASPSVKRTQLDIAEKACSSNRSSPTPQHNISISGKKSEPSVKQQEPKLKETSTEKTAPPIESSTESGKDNLNLIVVGHVDAGKSTLMGHLLFKLGCVSKKVIQKYEHETEKIGKQSFVYAWVLDEVEEERGRGITMDIGKSKFETSSKSITLLDAPGHKDFIPNMISGATQADAALLVIDATAGEFETGFESGGQTREHTLLIRSLGVNQLIVVINKMDNVSWSQQRFDEISQKLGAFLHQVGFKDADVCYVPCSGLMGINLIEKPKDPSTAWYKGPTLIDSIDKFNLPERPINKPLRMCVHDIYKNIGTYSVSGRIETGYMNVGNKVSIQPKGEVAVIKSLTVDDVSRSTAFAGTYVSVVLTNVDVESMCVGHVLCDLQHPIPVSNRFEAKIVLFDLIYPITKGYPITLHLLSLVDPVVITKLNAQLHKVTGEVMKKNPRCLMKNTAAIVTVETSRPICMELYKDVREFGRFMLRDSGVTVAAGLIVNIL